MVSVVLVSVCASAAEGHVLDHLQADGVGEAGGEGEGELSDDGGEEEHADSERLLSGDGDGDGEGAAYFRGGGVGGGGRLRLQLRQWSK